jgi:hypothetical protein
MPRQTARPEGRSTIERRKAALAARLLRKGANPEQVAVVLGVSRRGLRRLIAKRSRAQRLQ